MKITITIMNDSTGKSYDFQVDDKQKVSTTLRVIKENMPEVLEGLSGHYEIKSYRSKKHIEAEKTYNTLVDAFVKDFGSYHMTYSSSQDLDGLINHIFRIL